MWYCTRTMMLGMKLVVLFGIIVTVSQISCEPIHDIPCNSKTTPDQEDKKNKTIDINSQLNILSETINGWIKNVRSKVSRNVKPSNRAEPFPKSVQNVGKLAQDERGNFFITANLRNRSE
ncbi:uncharacterized protein LOC111087287 [Limulus polyphemus]|uniref:Uncharacterized protein LOC111087287 n=1 Tax=Limulus polyphemus TaxID=6850 RepID=A0ABM1SZR6_LIMPO|nr:uncharacterized protein LOC111087287 [Limulus polyphemus]